MLQVHLLFITASMIQNSSRVIFKEQIHTHAFSFLSFFFLS